jgi:hypothetical protein
VENMAKTQKGVAFMKIDVDEAQVLFFLCKKKISFMNFDIDGAQVLSL